MRTLLLKAEGDVDLMKAPLFKAAKQGNYEFLRIALNLYPRLTNELKDGNQTVLEVACHHYPDLLNKMYSSPYYFLNHHCVIENSMPLKVRGCCQSSRANASDFNGITTKYTNEEHDDVFLQLAAH